jgi:hypothetical protein
LRGNEKKEFLGVISNNQSSLGVGVVFILDTKAIAKNQE